jgi:hypothetical protein
VKNLDHAERSARQKQEETTGKTKSKKQKARKGNGRE